MLIILICVQGPALLCMNSVLGQLGEINTIKQERADNQTVVPCLAACEDQINQIYMSQSKLPNRCRVWPTALREEFI